jgi:pSer/pThr/pTyr-binding forkhead associated (FHA) protein
MTRLSKFSLVHLVGERVQDSPRTLELTEAEKVIGRSERAEFVVPIPSVSRRHAVVWVKDGVPHVKDLGSQYGTFVNSAPISGSTALRQGDLLSLGGNLLFLVNQEEVEGAEEAGEQVVDSSLVELALSGQATESKSRQYLEALYNLCLKTPVLTNEGQLLLVVLDELQQVISAERYYAMMGDDPATLTIVASKLTHPDKTKKWSLPSKEIIRRAMSSDKPIIAFDAKSDERFQGRTSIAMSDVHSAVCVGMRTGKTCLGVLYGDNHVGAGLFSLEDGDFVLAVARLVTLGLLQRRLRAQADQTLPPDSALTEIAQQLERMESLALEAEKKGELITFARQVRAASRRMRAMISPTRRSSPAAVDGPPESTAIGLGNIGPRRSVEPPHPVEPRRVEPPRPVEPLSPVETLSPIEPLSPVAVEEPEEPAPRRSATRLDPEDLAADLDDEPPSPRPKADLPDLPSLPRDDT